MSARPSASRIERSRRQGATVYLKLSGIDTPEEIAPLRGEYLQLPEQERPQLDAGEFFQSDILGLSVETTAGVRLGVYAMPRPL